MQTNRRSFIAAIALASQATIIEAAHAALPAVDPMDPQAKALGYTPDAAKVPAAFAAKHSEGAHCGNCALFQGKAAESPGPCPLFGGKAVQGTGWCGSWVAKAG